MKEHISVWQDEIELKPTRPNLKKNLETDTLIIGGGITGVTAAYLLAKQRKDVVLIEKDHIGAGETSRTTAFLNYHIDTYLQNLKKLFGEEKAIQVWTSEKMMIDAIGYISRQEDIECEFTRCPLYVFSPDKTGIEMLEEEYELSYRRGFAVKIDGEKLGFNYAQALRIDENAKFHPLKYLKSLAEKAEEHGALIFENTSFIEYEKNLKIKTEEAVITAKNIIFCTHNPVNISIEIQNRIIPNQTYILAAKISGSIIPEGMYIDTGTPYNYFRIDKKKGYDRIILGGQDHKTGEKNVNPLERYEKLENYLKNLLPKAKAEITHRWSGQVLDPTDGIPYIGKLLTHRKQLVSTGYAGDGMTFGTLGAFINADIILKKKNPWTDLYSLKRIKKPTRVLKSSLRVLKNFLGQRLEREEVALEEIKPDTGIVSTIKGEKIAFYKTKNKDLIKLSAVCTHMGCIVRWNNAEKTWDCPCHGSRFTKEGKVHNGPAKRDLGIKV